MKYYTYQHYFLHLNKLINMPWPKKKTAADSSSTYQPTYPKKAKPVADIRPETLDKLS